METTKVSSKGQVVLPKSVRDEYDWPAGTDLMIERGPSGVTLRRKVSANPARVDEVFGMLKYKGPPVSLADMERGVDAALRERWQRKGR